MPTCSGGSSFRNGDPWRRRPFEENSYSTSLVNLLLPTSRNELPIHAFTIPSSLPSRRWDLEIQNLLLLQAPEQREAGLTKLGSASHAPQLSRNKRTPIPCVADVSPQSASLTRTSGFTVIPVTVILKKSSSMHLRLNFTFATFPFTLQLLVTLYSIYLG